MRPWMLTGVLCLLGAFVLAFAMPASAGHPMHCPFGSGCNPNVQIMDLGLTDTSDRFTTYLDFEWDPNNIAYTPYFYDGEWYQIPSGPDSPGHQDRLCEVRWDLLFDGSRLYFVGARDVSGDTYVDSVPGEPQVEVDCKVSEANPANYATGLCPTGDRRLTCRFMDTIQDATTTDDWRNTPAGGHTPVDMTGGPEIELTWQALGEFSRIAYERGRRYGWYSINHPCATDEGSILVPFDDNPGNPTPPAYFSADFDVELIGTPALPAPEPGVASMLAAGTILLGALSRRR